MIVMRVTALILTVLLTGGLALQIHNLGQPWWLPPVLAMGSAVGVISSLWFGNPEALVRRTVAAADSYLFLNPRRACYTVSAVALMLVVVAGMIAVTWPPPTKFLSVSVYREKRVPEGFVVGAKVILLAEASGTTKISTIAKSGIARFDDLIVPTPIALQINEIRRGFVWSWAPKRFVLQSLPEIKDYDLSKVLEKEWTRIGPAQRTKSLSKTISTDKRRRDNEVGDTTLQAVNAPWGVPQAPLIVNRYAYILGFSPELRAPLWVAYAVSTTSQTVDSEMRSFRRDPAIHESMQSTNADYSRSGFDRGHLVSPQDVIFKGRVAVREAGYQTTLTPQAPNLNRFAWLRLERATRQLSRRLGREVYVIDGPLFEYVASPVTVGPNRIPVPSHFFRVVTWIEEGEFQWGSYLIPNSDTASHEIDHSIVPIGEIEKRTKLVLFPQLDPSTARVVKETPRGILSTTD